MEQSKSSYHRRLAYCKNKMATDKQNNDLWRQAVEVYSHLIKCNLSHTKKGKDEGECTHEFFGEFAGLNEIS